MPIRPISASAGAPGAFCVRLPYPPSVNHLWRRVGAKTLLSAEGRDYHERVASMVQFAIMTHAVPPAPHDVLIMAMVPDRRKRDVDNILKALLDPLYRALGLDDSVIGRLEVEKRGPDGAGGRVYVEIRPWR